MKKRLTIALFGDSLFNGDGVLPHRTWVTQVSRNVEQYGKRKRQPIMLNNFSVSGDTTRTALARMAYHIGGIRPNILVTQFGMNDCNRWETEGGVPRVAPAAFTGNLLEIKYRASAYGVTQTILLTTPPSNKSEDYQTRLRRYNEIVRDVSGAAYLVDVEARMLGQSLPFKDYGRRVDLAVKRYLQEDRIHLNERGHRLYAELVWDALAKVLHRW